MQKLLALTRKAINDYEMIADGDSIAVGVSGGKDSTALLLLMIERGLPIDAVIWADTGMEFPEMYAHIVRVDEHLYRERGLRITAYIPPRASST